MRIAVCCKGVPMDEDPESVEIGEGDIRFTDTDFDINEFDAYALEAAMDLKARYRAEITAISLGPLRNQEVLYYAVARGADEVIRIDGETSRPELIAVALSEPLKQIGPDLVLAGVQSEDWMGGEVGIFLAHALGMGAAYAVTEICELTDDAVRVLKEIGGGRKAEMVLPLPALLCVQSGISALHYLSAGRRRKARKTPIKLGGHLDREEAKTVISGMMGYGIDAVFLPPKEGHAEMIRGERADVASRIWDIIRNAA